MYNLLPPHAGQNFMQLTQQLSAWHRGRYNSLNFSALPEVPAAPWRPWFMGSKQNILAVSNSLIWMQTMNAPVTFSVPLAFTINLKFICWMRMAMFCKNGSAIPQKRNLNQFLHNTCNRKSGE